MKGVSIELLVGFKKVLRVFQGILRGVPRDLQVWFKGASRVPKRSSEGGWREFHDSLKDVLRKFQGCLKKVLSVFQDQNKFQGRFKNVSMTFCFAMLLLRGSHRSRAEGGLVYQYSLSKCSLITDDWLPSIKVKLTFLQ